MLHKYAVVLAGVGVAVVLSQPSTAWAQAGPNLVVAISHRGNFTVGVNGVYTIVVSNAGDTASSGMITVYDSLGIGSGVANFVSATGTGWICDLVDVYYDNVRCSSTSIIAPGGSASPITLTAIYFDSGTLTNTASIGNNTASDPTIVIAAVPTLPEWAMIVLSALLAVAGVAAMRRRTTEPPATR
jgi:uncharacterized repeat protein (TIGR01451 family)